MLRYLVLLPIALGLQFTVSRNGTVRMEPSTTLPTRTSVQSSRQCEALLRTLGNNDVFTSAFRLLSAVCQDDLREAMHGLEDGCLYLSENAFLDAMTSRMVNVGRSALPRLFENAFFRNTNGICPTDTRPNNVSSLGGFLFRTCENGFASTDGGCVRAQFVDHDTTSNIKLFVVTGRMGAPSRWLVQQPHKTPTLFSKTGHRAMVNPRSKKSIAEQHLDKISESTATQDPELLPKFPKNNAVMKIKFIFCQPTGAGRPAEWENMRRALPSQVERLNSLFRGNTKCSGSGNMDQHDTHLRFESTNEDDTVEWIEKDWCAKPLCAKTAAEMPTGTIEDERRELRETLQNSCYDKDGTLVACTTEKSARRYIRVLVCDLDDQDFHVFPADLPETYQGVVMNYWNMLGAKDRHGENSGVALARAFGMFLGLHRTYGGGCHRKGDIHDLQHDDYDGCSCGGDQIDDTPPQKKPNYVCYQPSDMDSCGSGDNRDAIHNVMDATPDECVCGFTRGQSWRMWLQLIEYDTDAWKTKLVKRASYNRDEMRTHVPTMSPTQSPR